jgi:CRISPR-associated protein Cas2
MRLVIAYDVTDDRRRRRLAKALEGCASRVEYSVFETDATKETEQRIRRIIEEEASPVLDHVRLYRICRGCESRTWIWGTGAYVDAPEDTVY